MKEYIQIQVTFPDLVEAREISKALLRKGYVACVSIIPLCESWFRWKGKIEHAQEVKVWLKTKRIYFPKIREYIIEKHTYEIPEILCLPIVHGSADYLQWIATELKKG